MIEKIAEKVFKISKAQQTEIMFYHNVEALTRFGQNQITQHVESDNQSMTIRMLDNKRTASISVSNFSDSVIEKAVELAVKMVHNKDAEILMKGKVGTSTLLKSVLNKEWGLRTGRLLSHFALFEVETYHKLLAVTDVAMNISPKLQEKIAIINNSVDCFHKLGITMPKVAVLGAVEMVNENMEATLDAALLSKMNQREQIKGCIIDGPLAFDNAVSIDSAKHKGIKSDVAGDTDLLLMPDLEVGNVLYKSLVFFANAKVASVILGAAAPIVLTSRSDSEQAKHDSILLASAASKNYS